MIKVVVWLVIIVSVLYTTVITTALWLSKNKPAAIAVAIIALAIILIPNFTILSDK